jgi:hypothetical protein
MNAEGTATALVLCKEPTEHAKFWGRALFAIDRDDNVDGRRQAAARSVPTLQIYFPFTLFLMFPAASVNKIISAASPSSCSATKDFKSALNVAGVVFIHYITALCVLLSCSCSALRLQLTVNILQGCHEGLRFWESHFVSRPRFGCIKGRGF